MEKIKKFNENWKNFFHPQESFNRKAEIYLSQFKKDYSERTISENILVECLFKLEMVLPESIGRFPEVLRYLGAIEAILVMEGYIEKGKKFDSEISNLEYKKRESYREHIIELAKNYLIDKGIFQKNIINKKK